MTMFYRNREEFYLKYLAETRPPRMPQERYMSIGSAFDAYCKSGLHAALFGAGSNPAYEFDAIFAEQVESQNRDWAREHGRYVFDCYCRTGAYQELLAMLSASKEPPRFEFTAEGTIAGVPLLGKPDCRFVTANGVHVILDWKVKGYCSKSAPSPSKHYRLCRDGYDAIALGIDRTKAAPDGKQSKSHGTAHAGYVPYNHRGLEIHAGYLEDANTEYADQLSLYGWLLGELPGDESVAFLVDEIVCKPHQPKPLIRVAQHRARVSQNHQMTLLQNSKKCWQAVTSGHIFSDLSREDNDLLCETLEQTAIGLQSDGSSEGDWFNQVARAAVFHKS